MATYNHFYELPVYKACRSFRKKVSSVANKNFSRTDDFLLKVQILGACTSQTLQKDLGDFIQENIQISRQSGGSWVKHLNR